MTAQALAAISDAMMVLLFLVLAKVREIARSNQPTNNRRTGSSFSTSRTRHRFVGLGWLVDSRVAVGERRRRRGVVGVAPRCAPALPAAPSLASVGARAVVLLGIRTAPSTMRRIGKRGRGVGGGALCSGRARDSAVPPLTFAVCAPSSSVSTLRVRRSSGPLCVVPPPSGPCFVHLVVAGRSAVCCEGWTIVRRKVSVQGRVKIACFMSSYVTVGRSAAASVLFVRSFARSLVRSFVRSCVRFCRQGPVILDCHSAIRPP